MSRRSEEQSIAGTQPDQSGGRADFEKLIGRNLNRLRAVVRRMIGHPEDTEDVVQDALLKAWNAKDDFRHDASFGTWLCAIGARAAIDHLRRRKRWRTRAQVAYAHACVQSEELNGEIGAVVSRPDFTYDAKEHIAYCFTCVGRSLPPEQQAALVLREVLGLTNRECADALEVTESVFRHSLSRARSTMEDTYEGLCALVNQNGVCYQCKGLRKATPSERRGANVPVIESFEQRLAYVRNANVDSGVSQAMHDLFWRRTREIEERADGSEVPPTDCDPEEE